MIDKELLGKLMCVKCLGTSFTENNDCLTCVSCGQLIPMREGIPDFLSVKRLAVLGWKEEDAQEYDAQIATVFKPYHLERIDRPILKWVKGDVLEIGCGMCRLAEQVSSRGCKYFGIDPVFSFLRYGYERYRLGRLVRGQGELLLFKEASFDTIISGFYAYRNVVPHMGLPQARRILKKNGIFVFDLFNHWFFKLLELKTIIRQWQLRRLFAFSLRPPERTFEFISFLKLERLALMYGFEVQDILSTPFFPVALFSFIDINKLFSPYYFHGPITVHLGYDVIIVLKAI